MANPFTIKVEGVAELQAKFKLINLDVQKVLSDAVSAGGKVVETKAKARVHVVTGNLKRSISELKKIESPGRAESQIGSNVSYAAVEEYRPGHQYLRPSLDENEAAISAAIESKLKAVLGRYG